MYGNVVVYSFEVVTANHACITIPIVPNHCVKNANQMRPKEIPQLPCEYADTQHNHFSPSTTSASSSKSFSSMKPNYLARALCAARSTPNRLIIFTLPGLCSIWYLSSALASSYAVPMFRAITVFAYSLLSSRINLDRSSPHR